VTEANSSCFNSGTRFTLSRDELLTLPEFVLLSLFPNGLFPEGHMGGFAEGDAVQVDVGDTEFAPSQDSKIADTNAPHSQCAKSLGGDGMVDNRPACPNATVSDIRNVLYDLDIHIADACAHPQYDPASLQYMLDFFRNVAQSIPTEPSGQESDGVVPLDPGARDDSSRRAGIIVLREDLDFYAIPHKKDIGQPEMIEVKRAAAKALLKQDGIFSGLKRSDEPGTTEAHLIEMLTAGYVFFFALGVQCLYGRLI